MHLLRIVVRHELAVNFLIVPGFGHLVHDADGVWNNLTDGCGSVCEELHVPRLVMARVPSMLTALSAYFEHESDLLVLLLLCHPKIQL